MFVFWLKIFDGSSQIGAVPDTGGAFVGSLEVGEPFSDYHAFFALEVVLFALEDLCELAAETAGFVAVDF